MWNHGMENRRAQVTFACVAIQALITRCKRHTVTLSSLAGNHLKQISSIHSPLALPGSTSQGQVGGSMPQEGWMWSLSKARGSARTGASAEPHQRAFQAAEYSHGCRSGGVSITITKPHCSSLVIRTEVARSQERLWICRSEAGSGKKFMAASSECC